MMSFLARLTHKNKTNNRKTQKNKSSSISLNCSPAIQGKTATTDTCFTPNILTKIKLKSLNKLRALMLNAIGLILNYRARKGLCLYGKRKRYRHIY